MTTVWSCGGGTQSAAIAALIVLGELPKPAAAVIADTGREASATWRYYDNVLKPQLSKVGVDLVRLPHSFFGPGWNTVDLLDGKGKPLMPMFTNISGEIGQTRKYCSNEWKARPCERYYRSLGLKSGEIWIGFSSDEAHRWRAPDPDAAWNQVYPLVERRMSRSECIALVTRRMGWPDPPRSSCSMCPYRSDAEWTHLRKTDPADFAAAVRLERETHCIDPHLFLHRSCKPLDTVDFGEAQIDLLVDADHCASGHCFT